MFKLLYQNVYYIAMPWRTTTHDEHQPAADIALTSVCIFTAILGTLCYRMRWSLRAMTCHSIRGVKHNELVLLPVAHLTGFPDGVLRRNRPTTTAAGLCRRVRLAVWSKRALRTAGVWRFDVLHPWIYARNSPPVSLSPSRMEKHWRTLPLFSGLRGSVARHGVLLTGYYAALRYLPEGVCGAEGLQGDRKMPVEASRAFGWSADCVVQAGRTVRAHVHGVAWQIRSFRSYTTWQIRSGLLYTQGPLGRKI